MDREVIDYIESSSRDSFNQIEAITFENQAIDALSPSIKKEKNKKFIFTRQVLFFIIIACNLILAAVLFFENAEAVEGMWLFAFLISLIIQIFAVIGWEKKMQRSVSHLIKVKLEQLSDGASTSHSSFNPTLQGESEEYKNQINGLAMQLENQESTYQHQIDLLHSSLEKNKVSFQELSYQLDRKIEELAFAHQEAADVHREYERLKNEWEIFTQENYKQLNHKDLLLQEYLQTIAEQRKVIEKKQQTVSRLEERIQDLMYEVRSLLHLESPVETMQNYPLMNGETQSEDEIDLDPIAFSQCEGEEAQQLSRFIEAAHNFTGLSHLASGIKKPSRILDLTLDNNALDWRSFFNLLKDEPYAIFFFSLAEDKMLFINSCIKDLLGWAPEKFIKEFQFLIVNGKEEWNLAINEPFFSRKSLELIMKTREGTDRPITCHLQMILKGPFSSHIIGILS